ncbi:MAG: hypothetical protein ING75_08325 [Rhodocyclaceae bacterium]|nr:hypothetical protein [Rhodocyclaceae bacterium]
MRISRLLIAVLLAPSVVLAEPLPPPVFPFESAVPAKKVAYDPIRYLQLGQFRVAFEKTTLDEVLRRLGTGKIAHIGDASESNYWLCYTSNQAQSSYRLWISSSGEMGGPQHSVTHFAAEPIMANAWKSDECPELPKQFQRASLDGKIWLNTSVREVERALGKPASIESDWRRFYFEKSFMRKSSTVGAPKEEWTVSSWLYTKGANGRITLLAAGVITSN